MNGPMKWFRYYSESLESKKVQDLPPRLFKFWVNLLALANFDTTRGNLPNPNVIGFRLRLKPETVTKYLRDLTERRLVDSDTDTIRMHNWDKWQRVSDSSAERMAHKRRTSSEDVPNSSALDKSRVETEQNKRENKEAEAEQEPEAGGGANGSARAMLLAYLTTKYQNEIGTVTPVIADALDDWAERIPDSIHAEYAFAQAAESGARNWRYVESVLKRLEEDKWPADPSYHADSHGLVKADDYDWLQKMRTHD